MILQKIFVKYLFPFWLAAIPIFQRYSDSIDSKIPILSWILFFPTVISFLFYKKALNFSSLHAGLYLFLLSSMIIGLLISRDPVYSLGHLTLTCTALIAMKYFFQQNTNLIISSLRVYSILLLAIFYFGFLSGATDSRFSFYTNPNGMALIMFSGAIFSLLIKSIYLKTAMLCSYFFLILMTGSRSGLLSLIVAISVYYILNTTNNKKKVLLLTFAVIFLIFGALLFLYGDMYSFLSDILLLDDDYRGIGSGFSGRIYAWTTALSLYLDNPLFGVGFRQHESYFSGLWSGESGGYQYRISSSHNGYLASLAELGTFGFLAVSIIIFIAASHILKNNTKAQDHLLYSCLAGFMAGYMVISFFERFLINSGNPTSLIFLGLMALPLIKNKYNNN